MRVEEEHIKKAKDTDIVEFLAQKGRTFTEKGRMSICSSPFSSDSTPSFVVYTDQNRWHDFSTGFHGDAIELAQKLLDISFLESVRLLNGDEMPVWNEKEHTKKAKKRKPFHIDNYTTGYDHEIKAIDEYARSRGITKNYMHGFFAKKEGGQWLRFPSIMFPHYIKGKITGAKFRNIGDIGDRFTARGQLGIYECYNILHEGYSTYVVEGEANANSLCEYFEYTKENAIVISFGGVSTITEDIPNEGGNLFPYIIIDFDGNEELYQERLKAYDVLKGIPIKMMLPKGEDLNSLWADGEIDIIKEMLINK